MEWTLPIFLSTMIEREDDAFTEFFCAQGQELCNGECVDIANDRYNCGTCGNVDEATEYSNSYREEEERMVESSRGLDSRSYTITTPLRPPNVVPRTLLVGGKFNTMRGIT